MLMELRPRDEERFLRLRKDGFQAGIAIFIGPMFFLIFSAMASRSLKF